MYQTTKQHRLVSRSTKRKVLRCRLFRVLCRRVPLRDWCGCLAAAEAIEFIRFLCHGAKSLFFLVPSTKRIERLASDKGESGPRVSSAGRASTSELRPCRATQPAKERGNEFASRLGKTEENQQRKRCRGRFCDARTPGRRRADGSLSAPATSVSGSRSGRNSVRIKRKRKTRTQLKRQNSPANKKMQNSTDSLQLVGFLSTFGQTVSCIMSKQRCRDFAQAIGRTHEKA